MFNRIKPYVRCWLLRKLLPEWEDNMGPFLYAVQQNALVRGRADIKFKGVKSVYESIRNGDI